MPHLRLQRVDTRVCEVSKHQAQNLMFCVACMNACMCRMDECAAEYAFSATYETEEHVYKSVFYVSHTYSNANDV